MVAQRRMARSIEDDVLYSLTICQKNTNMYKGIERFCFFIHYFSSRARMKLIAVVSEGALRALQFGSIAIKNGKALANRHGQKVHDIVRFLLLLFDAELKLGQFFVSRNQLFELSNLAAPPLKMMNLLPIAMAKKYMLL